MMPRVSPESAVKTFWFVAIAACANTCHGQEAVDKAKATAFDNRMFAGPLGQKTYACFVRRYDAGHLAQHPTQKVSALKLLVTAEDAPEDKTVNYSFRLGFKYRHRPGNFDSSGFCNHVVTEKSGNEIRLGCGVDCEGGGIEVAMSTDDKSALSGSSESGFGSATRPTTTPATIWLPAPTTRFSASTALNSVNVRNW